jgi:hypothetical protein
MKLGRTNLPTTAASGPLNRVGRDAEAAHDAPRHAPYLVAPPRGAVLLDGGAEACMFRIDADINGRSVRRRPRHLLVRGDRLLGARAHPAAASVGFAAL